MKKSELQKIIKEELQNTLNEGSLENKIADLYAYAGINTKYDDRMVARYGKNVVNQATAMAPKILAYQKKVQAFAKDLKNSPEGKLLMLIAKSKKGYRGDNDFVSVGDVFNLEEIENTSFTEGLWDMISGKDASIDKQMIAKKHWDEIVKIMKTDNAKIEANFKNLDQATQKQFVTVAAKAAADGSLKNMKAIASLMMDIENSQPVFGDKIKELCAKIAAV